MDIDITPINDRNVDIPSFLKFVDNELKKHISLVKNRDYKKIALATSNKNNFKKFFEEIVPLMFFLKKEKDLYSTVKYMSGDQKGDAILDNSTLVEITKAENESRYLFKKDMINHGYAFSSKNIQKNKTLTASPTKTQPYVYINYEHVIDGSRYIYNAIESKLNNNYPDGSILIILFESDHLMSELDGDYSCLEKEIMNYAKGVFSKIYIIENFINDDLQPRWQFIL